jgi:peptide/nickel transport system permease protein
MPDATEEFQRRQALKEEAKAEGGLHDIPLQREVAAAADVPETQLPPGIDRGLADAAAGGIVITSQRELAWRRFKKHKAAMVSGVLLILIILASLAAPLLTSYTFSETDITATLEGPSMKHYFGTDTLGRDAFTRVLYGGRISLLVGFSVAIIATAIGAFVGAIAGYYGGWLDNLLMRVTDLFLSVPFLVVLILGSLLLGPGVFETVLVLSLFFWMFDARIVRGIYLSMKEKEFVEAARASGASNKRIIFREMLPNAMGPIIVASTLAVAAAILTESVLSFLGYGIQPPTPTWGNLLDDAKNLAVSAPWLILFPGIAILVTVLCVNYLGDGLRDAFDPQGQGKSL